MRHSAVKSAIARKLSRSFPRLWMERELRFRPNHFEREYWLIPIFCEKNKIAIDIGANSGTYSYYMKKFAKTVIAFEPNTDLLKGLRQLLGSDFQLESTALSGKSSRTTMRIDPGNTGISTIEEGNDLRCADDMDAIILREVETRTLDSYNFNDVSFIKIDVEGHEESVVDGARKTIERNRPSMIIESENRHNSGAPDRLAEVFLKLNYLVFYVKDLKLRDYNTLSPEDLDSGNLAVGGATYVNNFIYIPAEQTAKVARARAALGAV